MRTRIKVCGITSIDDAIAAIACGADAIGFVFVEDTPRFIEPEEAALIMDALPPFVTTVGVVRDLSVDQFCELEQRCPAHYFQLHGKEPVDVVKQCTPAIKAFKYEPATIESQLSRWTKQYRLSETETIPEMDRLIEWLEKTVPDQRARP